VCYGSYPSSRIASSDMLNNSLLTGQPANNRAATSAISSLSLKGYQISTSRLGPLTEILKWPIALRVFRLTVSWNCLKEATPPPPEAILNTLAPHQASLEELYIDHSTWESKGTKTQPLKLHNFSQLKTLGVTSNYLTWDPNVHSKVGRHYL
jgi:hypothetical protein